MFDTFMQTNAVLYGMGILCILGALSQIILGGFYRRMRKDTENEHKAKGKFIRQVRQRYDMKKRMNGTVNTENFIEKNLQQYRRMGMSLHQWRKIGGVTLAASLGLGGFGYYLTNTQRIFQDRGSLYLWAMAVCTVFMAAVYGLTDIRYRKNCLLVGLTDLLEGSAVQGKTAGEERIAGKEEKEEIAGSRRPFKQAREQKDRREKKENLMRVKEALGESAASREKERDAEILKNMDPAEQERVIREVLKEFLS